MKNESRQNESVRRFEENGDAGRDNFGIKNGKNDGRDDRDECVNDENERERVGYLVFLNRF